MLERPLEAHLTSRYPLYRKGLSYSCHNLSTSVTLLSTTLYWLFCIYFVEITKKMFKFCFSLSLDVVHLGSTVVYLLQNLNYDDIATVAFK